MKSFVAVGRALFTIRDSKLYREEFKTFNEYCNVRWGMGKSYAGYLISGSQVAVNLLTHDDHPGGQLCTPCEIQPTSEGRSEPSPIFAWGRGRSPRPMRLTHRRIRFKKMAKPKKDYPERPLPAPASSPVPHLPLVPSAPAAYHPVTASHGQTP